VAYATVPSLEQPECVKMGVIEKMEYVFIGFLESHDFYGGNDFYGSIREGSS
jgi:hypothetical protein